MVDIQSCGGIITNRGYNVATMFIIFGRLIEVTIISVSGEVGVIITVIRSILMRERLTIAVVKDKPTGILVGKGMDMINDLIRNGEGGPFAADNCPA